MSPALDPTIRELNDCECCDGVAARTPVEIANRPGLTAIAYRVGTHAAFKASMLAALSDARRSDLGAFNTRDDDDFSIALLDAWATVADVLTFYQERIANESYLRTAVERRSVLELARAIGYELAPGVAAGTLLAFTVEDGGGAPRSATGLPPVMRVPVGTAAQSIPGQDEQPQTFETTEEIEARAEWNELRPSATESKPLTSAADVLFLLGTETGLVEGDAVAIVGSGRANNPASADWDFARVRRVETISEEAPLTSYTQATLDRSVKAVVNPTVYALRERAALFGSNAPDWRTMPLSLKASALGVAETSVPTSITEWPDLSLTGVDVGMGLMGEYFGANDFTDRRLTRLDPVISFDWKTGAPDPSMSADNFSVRWSGFVRPKVTGTHTFRVEANDRVRLSINGKEVVKQQLGQDPPPPPPTSVDLVRGVPYAIQIEYVEFTGSANIKLLWSAPGLAEEVVPSQHLYHASFQDIYLDTLHPKVFAGSWVVLSTPSSTELYRVDAVAESARTKFTLSAKTTRLTLSGKDLFEKFNDRIRETTGYAVSEELKVIGAAIVTKDDPVAGETIELEGGDHGLRVGQHLAFSGTESDSGTAGGTTASEVATIKAMATVADVTTLTLTKQLGHTYRRDGLLINANVAAATHGETKAETLGSGDASAAFQRFTLHETPLTYTSASDPSGRASTLRVRVNDVLWREVPTLYGRGPRERVYITRADDLGNTTVIFGDGRTGARLPTGIENVTAVYRKGIGTEGEVAAEQISLLVAPPLGVSRVVNPEAAAGAADPQTVAETRENAPLTVLTLDRIVSLRDHEDFARSFAGIGKALATWTWNGNARGVLITIAGSNGEEIADDAVLRTNLLAAIAKSGDPSVRVVVRSYRSVPFTVRGTFAVDPDYLVANVRAAIEAALGERFSFAARSFGQPVTLSEVVAAVQSVPGVVAVDIDSIHRVEGGTAGLDPLIANAPRPGDPPNTEGAELLTIDLNKLDLKVAP